MGLFASLGPHAGFIVAAYLVTFGVVLGLILWIAADRRGLRRQLADLERQGIRRRSQTGETKP